MFVVVAICRSTLHRWELVADGTIIDTMECDLLLEAGAVSRVLLDDLGQRTLTYEARAVVVRTEGLRRIRKSSCKAEVTDMCLVTAQNGRGENCLVVYRHTQLFVLLQPRVLSELLQCIVAVA